MAEPVASNQFLLNLAQWQRTRFNVRHSLKLFQNNVGITPATDLSAFVEATFPGYAPIDTDLLFPAPIKVIDGEYQMILPEQLWIPSANDPQFIFGWYLEGLGQVEYSGNFLTPKRVHIGEPIILNLTIQSWALSVACI